VALNPTELSQSLYETGDPTAPGRKRARSKETNCRQLVRLLRPRHEGPRRRRATEECDEVAPFHSITSSARANARGFA
jgi:hypothetical protein